MANETTANAEKKNPEATQKTRPQPTPSPRPLPEELDSIDWGPRPPAGSSITWRRGDRLLGPRRFRFVPPRFSQLAHWGGRFPRRTTQEQKNRQQPPKADISRWTPPYPTDVGVRTTYFEFAAERWYNQTVREIRMVFGKYDLRYSAIRKGHFLNTRFAAAPLVFLVTVN